MRPQLSWIEYLPSKLNSQSAPKGTHADSHGPTDTIFTFQTTNSGPMGTQVDRKISKQYQIAVSDFVSAEVALVRHLNDPELTAASSASGSPLPRCLSTRLRVAFYLGPVWSIAKPEKPSGVGRANIHHVLIPNNCWCQIGILPVTAIDQSRGRLEHEALVGCRPGKNEILARDCGS